MNALPIPGFVDLQVNGCLGVDFSSPDLTEADCRRACHAMLHSGTAAFLPTLITSPLEVYARNLPLLARLLDEPEFKGRLLGLHLEGPFISAQPGAVGAHDPQWVRPPDEGVLAQLLDWGGGHVRLLTLAAELDGAERLARLAVTRGAIVAIGHTLAAPDDLDRLYQAGASLLTHLGNGLPGLLPKFANPLWAGLADDRYLASFIGDGHHIPDGILKAFLRVKGLPRAIIVSDAASVAGLPPGDYSTLGNQAILEPSGRLHNPAKGCLVGSSYTLLRCINHLLAARLASLDDCLALGFANPLRLLNLPPASISCTSRLFFDEECCQILPSPADQLA